jgi:adenine-specific DNA-methyltransferase
MSIDKLDLQTPDLVNVSFEKLAKIFPNCVTETTNGKAIDFDILKQELSHAVIEGNKERYRLEWPGKREAIVTANLPTTKTLRPVREDSVNFDNTENLYIEGDNLEVLKLLQESYLGKIKVIYIDPPYNTGKDFVYKDNFTGDKETELFESGQKDEYNQRLVVNPETSGRYHSDWLSMMYPRLKLARNLLTENGAIFISIDDNEVHNLRKVCDEVFGEENFINTIIWEKRYSPQNAVQWFSEAHDFILVYAKIKEIWQPNLLERSKEMNDRYRNLDNDPRGDWKPTDATAQAGHGTASQFYELGAPSGQTFQPPNGRCWVYTKDRMQEMIADNRVWFGSEGKSAPAIKRFLTEVKQGVACQTIWKYEDVGHNQEGKKEIKILFPESVPFDTPKPTRLIYRILKLCTDANSNDIVLDFFSGSATSAHAVMQLNVEDGAKRRHIQVQLPASTDKKSEAFNAGYENICEIAKDRIRRAGKKIKSNLSYQIAVLQNELEKKTSESLKEQIELINTPEIIDELNTAIEELNSQIKNKKAIFSQLDIGFRVYRLDESNMQDVYYKPQDYKQEAMDLFADNVKPDRTPDDLLAQVMLDWGLSLSLKIEQIKIAGKQVFKVAENSLYACFDKGIDEEFAKAIAKDAPLRIVFRDNGFTNDTAKINVKQLLKQLSPETEMKVI